jgi:hypothetical protein
MKVLTNMIFGVAEKLIGPYPNCFYPIEEHKGGGDRPT